jgi:copper chaperone CopZ
MSKITFPINGMHCTGCALGIEAILKGDKAIKSAAVNYANEKATVEYNEKKLTPEKIAAIIAKAGYTAVLPDQKKKSLRPRSVTA